MTLEVYADGKADNLEATTTRLPIKLNDVTLTPTFATFSAVGTYEIELDCSKFIKTDFLIRFAGASSNLLFSSYLTCNIVVTNLLTIKTIVPPVVVVEPQLFKNPTSAISGTTIQTKTAKVLRVESIFTPSDALTTTRGDLFVQNVGNTKYLEPYDKINKTRVIHPLNISGGSGLYLKVMSAGQGVAVKTISYYDVTEIPEIRINFYVASGAGTMTASSMFLDAAFETLDTVIAPVVETIFLKTPITLSSNVPVKTKNARLLKVEITSTANDALSTTSMEASMINTDTSKYIEPFNASNSKRITHSSSILGSQGKYLKIKTAGQSVIIKTVAYYDVTEVAEVKLLYYTSSGSMTNSVSAMFLDIPFENQELIDTTAYKGKSFTIETCKPIVDCYMNTFIQHPYGGDYIDISISGIDGVFDRVALNNTNFPNLKAGSLVFSALVIPYTKNLDVVKEQRGRDARVCIVTTKGQVYHNFPKRGTGTSDGTSLSDDHLKFDQSAMWDLATNQTTRKFPSTDVSESRDGFRYDPSLPSFSYQLDPPINTDTFAYGNGGFPAVSIIGDVKRPRYYSFKEPDGSTVGNPFRILTNNKVKSKKITVLGTYQIEASRVCLIGTSDGGRNWVVLYEFASLTHFGNAINLSSLPSYTANSFAVEYRDFIPPNSVVKDPINKFSYSGEVVISSISAANPAVVTTATNHGFVDKNIIRLKRKTAGSVGLEFMLNDSANSTNSGTGMFYMVKKLTDTTFELREHIYSPDNNLRVRHIHYANLLKDFISFGTGELYPEGWVMLLEAKEKDASSIVDFMKDTPLAYRLNSSQTGVQRLCSFWMLDDHPTNPTIYFGSDEVNIDRPQLIIEGRTGLPKRSSAGVFKGKLADIDDMGKFTSVLDIDDSNLYCIDLNGIKIAGFQSDHNAISLDNGNTWEQFNMEKMLEVAWVDSKNYIYFNTGYRLKINNK